MVRITRFPIDLFPRSMKYRGSEDSSTLGFFYLPITNLLKWICKFQINLINLNKTSFFDYFHPESPESAHIKRVRLKNGNKFRSLRFRSIIKTNSRDSANCIFHKRLRLKLQSLGGTAESVISVIFAGSNGSSCENDGHWKHRVLHTRWAGVQ